VGLAGWLQPGRLFGRQDLAEVALGIGRVLQSEPGQWLPGCIANGQYFNAFAGQGERITSVVFRSNGNAFEIDNHAVITVPEPGSWALMLIGLGALGFVAKRRGTA
jgi:hypothetical protein